MGSEAKKRTRWGWRKVVFVLTGLTLVALPALAHLAPSSMGVGQDGEETADRDQRRDAVSLPPNPNNLCTLPAVGSLDADARQR